MTTTERVETVQHPDWCEQSAACLESAHDVEHLAPATQWRAQDYQYTVQISQRDERPGGTLIAQTLWLRLAFRDLGCCNADGSPISMEIYLDSADLAYLRRVLEQHARELGFLGEVRA
jgi:hypothetical protein